MRDWRYELRPHWLQSQGLSPAALMTQVLDPMFQGKPRSEGRIQDRLGSGTHLPVRAVGEWEMHDLKKKTWEMWQLATHLGRCVLWRSHACLPNGPRAGAGLWGDTWAYQFGLLMKNAWRVGAVSKKNHWPRMWRPQTRSQCSRGQPRGSGHICQASY